MSSTNESAPALLSYASDTAEDIRPPSAAGGEEADDEDGQQFRTPMMETRSMRARTRSLSASRGIRPKSGSRMRGQPPYPRRGGKAKPVVDKPAISTESLQWDGSGLSLLDATARSQLWSPTAHVDVPLEDEASRPGSTQTALLNETVVQPRPEDVQAVRMDTGTSVNPADTPSMDSLGMDLTPPGFQVWRSPPRLREDGPEDSIRQEGLLRVVPRPTPLPRSRPPTPHSQSVSPLTVYEALPALRVTIQPDAITSLPLPVLRPVPSPSRLAEPSRQVTW